MLKFKNLFDNLDGFKSLAEDELHSISGCNYCLIKDSIKDHWLFSYVNHSGKIVHHPIRSFYVGESKIYKNGFQTTTSNLESLIDALSNGKIQIGNMTKTAA